MRFLIYAAVTLAACVSAGVPGITSSSLSSSATSSISTVSSTTTAALVAGTEGGTASHSSGADSMLGNGRGAVGAMAAAFAVVAALV